MDREKDALEKLYRERYRTFRDVLAGIVGSHDLAREVVQEAFARALRERHKWRGEGTLEAWVWRIAINVALKTRKELRRRWELEEAPPPEPLAESDHDVRAVVRSLPPRRRLLVFLRYFADLTYAEIAQATNVAEGTVAATLAQAHAELRELVEREGVKR